MINKVIVVGYVGQDARAPEKTTNLPMAFFSVATSEKYKDKNGDLQENTEWHSISVFGKMASACLKYVTQGMLVYVEGKIRTREWVGSDDTKHKSTGIVASTVQFLGSKNATRYNSQDKERFPGQEAHYDVGGRSNVPDDDIPF
jgi:single-strand DNA-binding protein